MGETTAIAWTDRTWNPWQGCHKKSPGCLNCYMFRDKKRYGKDPDVVVRSAPATFNAPLSKKWAEPKLVFTCSWSDFFIEEADAWRNDAFDIIRDTQHLTYQVLTKRQERMVAALVQRYNSECIGYYRNLWLGVTVEDQGRENVRTLCLSAAPAAVKFVSVEPMLTPVLFGYPELLHWVIIGAESGPNARPCRIEWVRALVEQCRSAGVPVFVKQLHIDGRLSTDPSEWPEDLRVREMPHHEPHRAA